MGGFVLYSHPLLPHYSSSSTPNFRKPFLISLKETADRPLVSRIIRAVDARSKGPNDNYSQPLDGRSSSSSNKEEILALFERIQSSISKGDTANSKKRNNNKNNNKNKNNNNNNNNSAESILEVLHQSRARGKGKKPNKNGDKFLAHQNYSPKKDEAITNRSSTTGLKPTRLPSSFTRRSPIPTQPSPGTETEPENESLPERAEDENSEHITNKFEEMKLTQLKEVAKCKGIKGYSKLKKSELLELLISSLGNTTS